MNAIEKARPTLDVTAPGTEPLSTPEQKELERLETIAHRHKEGALAFARALHEIKEKNLWRGKATSFMAYCRLEYQISESQVYRRLKDYEVAEGVVGTEGLSGEAFRILARLPPEKRTEVLDFARRQVAGKDAPLFVEEAQAAPAEELRESVTPTAEDISLVVQAFNLLPAEQQADVVAAAEESIIRQVKDRLPGKESDAREAEDYRLKALKLIERARKIAERFGWQEWMEEIKGAYQKAPVLGVEG